jgi:hypothetical protein
MHLGRYGHYVSARQRWLAIPNLLMLCCSQNLRSEAEGTRSLSYKSTGSCCLIISRATRETLQADKRTRCTQREMGPDRGSGESTLLYLESDWVQGADVHLKLDIGLGGQKPRLAPFIVASYLCKPDTHGRELQVFLHVRDCNSNQM